MRILAISDAHGSARALGEVGAMASNFDLLLVAGDLTDFGDENEARELLESLDPYAGRVALVPGNCDKKGARTLFLERGISADGRCLVVGGARVAGAGGSPFHTGITPYERKDRELGTCLAAALEMARGLEEGSPLIALTHTPPKGSGADRVKNGEAGSPALREILDRSDLPLWVCGHIHESPCVATLGRSLVINPGPLREGSYAVVSLAPGEGGVWRAEAKLLRL